MDEDAPTLKDSHSIAASKSAGVQDEHIFVYLLPLSPKPKGKLSGSKQLSKSEDSTAVAGRLSETDESYQPSRDVTSADDLPGSQSAPKCWTEEDSLFGSQGNSARWELAKQWELQKCTGDAVFHETLQIMKVEMMLAR